MTSCCCCFSNNVRHLMLLAAIAAIIVLYANLILFNFSSILHKNIPPNLRPVESLDSLHEYSIWHDRRKRAYNLTSTADKEEKIIYTEEEGYPILPSTEPTPTISSTTTILTQATSPRLIFFTNSPTFAHTTMITINNASTTASLTTRIGRQTVGTKTGSTRISQTTTLTTIETPITPNVALKEVQKAIEKKKDKDLFIKPTDIPEKVEGERKPLRDVTVLPTIEKTSMARFVVYSAPGIGVLIGTLPLMFLVKVLGVRLILPMALIVSGSLLIVLPFIVHNEYLLFIVRSLLGVSFSASFPAAGALTATWGTLSEQLCFITTIFMFFVLAPIYSWPITMVLYSNEVDILWIYIIHAVLTFITALLFFIFYRDQPQDHPWVNGIELNRIIAGKVRDLKTNRASSAPCSLLLRSLSAWSIWVAAFGCFTVFALFSTYLPSFLSCQQVFMVDHLGAYSILPYCAVPLFFLIGGLLNNLSCSSTTLHVRICNTLAFITEALLLFILPIIFHAGTDNGLNIPMLLLSLGPLGLIVSGFLRSATLVGRGFAQHIISCFGFCFGLSYVVIPVAVSFIVNENSLKQWSIVFFITAGLLAMTSILFGLFGRGRSAGWAESTWDPLVRTKMLTTDPIDISADECGLYEMKLIPKQRA